MLDKSSELLRKLPKKFGFGCMRLPMKNGEVDYQEFIKMADSFVEAGFNYFDTAHGYLEGKSEIAIRECVVKRYPRESFILTNKLSGPYFKSEEEVRKIFQIQLEACGVDYFDIYLMHAQGRGNYPHFKQCKAYEQAFELKKEGKVKHVGLSFHDSADYLDLILTEYPQIEIVQIQFNYLDYEDAEVQSRACYEVCLKHGKPCLIMEPVKGGQLANMPTQALDIFNRLGSASPASYAIRFCASFDNNVMILSGMSNLEQAKDNISFMKDFKPLTLEEFKAIEEVKALLEQLKVIPCTACRYCVEGCPQKILIPDLFACYNEQKVFTGVSRQFHYDVFYTKKNGKASDCIECGACESICPQHLSIRELLKDVAKEFEK